MILKTLGPQPSCFIINGNFVLFFLSFPRKKSRKSHIRKSPARFGPYQGTSTICYCQKVYLLILLKLIHEYSDLFSFLQLLMFVSESSNLYACEF